MKYHGLQLQPMQESGASLLRAMQNESMMRLDLLARESIQNVLDAAIEGPGGEVRVNFRFTTHATDTIAALLADGIDRKVLRSRFPDGGQLLEIRDSLTVGLTGPLSLTDIRPGEEHGNLLKLVYEIGRTRSNEGAGGSWGLGKTCYFRMGVGLVFYYSRIQCGHDFEERLVACLVEDPGSPECLQSHTQTGIGWWGAEHLKPVTRGSQVRDILSKLGIRRFAGEETGTAIIIPFLRDDLIPPPEVASDDAETRAPAASPWWTHSYEDFIMVSVQRWFSTRLDNNLFATGPRLSVTVNNKPVRTAGMLPVFQVVQALYNRAVHPEKSGQDYFTERELSPDSILCQKVSIRNVFRKGAGAGTITAVLLTPEQLQMREPNNYPDPYSCIFGRSDGIAPHCPIVTFVRSPGMSICWDSSTESSSWSGGLNGSADGRYLIALFTPDQGRVLTSDLGQALSVGAAKNDVTLEYYLRSCERADHHQWADTAGQTIIRRIRSNTGKLIKDFGGKTVRTIEVAPAIRMARNLADLLMPQRGAGSDGRHGKRSPKRVASGAGNSGKLAQPAIKILSVDFLSDAVRVSWELVWGLADLTAGRELVLEVDSEGGSIGESEWLEAQLGSFPFRIAEVVLDSVTGNIGRFTTARRGAASILFSPNDSLRGGTVLKGSLKIVINSAASRMLLPSLRAVISAESKVVA